MSNRDRAPQNCIGSRSIGGSDTLRLYQLQLEHYAVQVDALIAAGCEHIFSELPSGVTDDRRQFEKMMRVRVPGDSIADKLELVALSSRRWPTKKSCCISATTRDIPIVSMMRNMGVGSG
jgi:hypothetical protein